MTQNHTPGQWTANDVYVVDARNKVVVDVSSGRNDMSYEEAQANAALIARAPDLLIENERLREENKKLRAALQAVYELRSYVLNAANKVGHKPEYAFRQARAVLAKAGA